MKEIWKPIKNFEHLYLISNNGKVKSLDRKARNGTGYRTYKGKELSGANKAGYRYVILYNNQHATNRMIHRLVAETFIVNSENKYCVNHKNGNKSDNRVDNLEWVSSKENTDHAIKLGLIKNKGEKGSFSKLKDWMIPKIREMYKSGKYSQRQIGDYFKVKQTTIYYILSGKTWTHIK